MIFINLVFFIDPKENGAYVVGGMLLFLAEKKEELRKAKQEIADSSKELEAAKEVCQRRLSLTPCKGPCGVSN